MKKINKATLDINGIYNVYVGSNIQFVDRLGKTIHSKVTKIYFGKEFSDLTIETESGKTKNYNFRNVVSWDTE